jgi:acyl carrier protein
MSADNEGDKIFTVIKSLLAENYSVPAETITMESTFTDLGMDSLDTLELINDLEQNFKITMENSEISKIKTVGGAVQSLEKLIEKNTNG